jgi:hypothetical protein
MTNSEDTLTEEERWRVRQLAQLIFATAEGEDLPSEDTDSRSV